MIARWLGLPLALSILSWPLDGLAGDIRPSYVKPKNVQHQALYDKLRAERPLERIASRVRVRLPRPLTIQAKGCDGEINAWYDPDTSTITICYEYVAYIQELSQTISPAGVREGLTPENYPAGPFLEVTLHELAHAVFDMQKVPILGREEDAADQLAAFALLRLEGDVARRAIASISVMYAKEANEAAPKLKDFADEHGLPAQRLYNLLCLAYGFDRKRYGDLVEKGYLPAQRAEACPDEYKQVAYAYKRLIAKRPSKSSR